jgi:hypothetical protein
MVDRSLNEKEETILPASPCGCSLAAAIQQGSARLIVAMENF